MDPSSQRSESSYAITTLVRHTHIAPYWGFRHHLKKKIENPFYFLVVSRSNTHTCVHTHTHTHTHTHIYIYIRARKVKGDGGMCNKINGIARM